MHTAVSPGRFHSMVNSMGHHKKIAWGIYFIGNRPQRHNFCDGLFVHSGFLIVCKYFVSKDSTLVDKDEIE